MLRKALRHGLSVAGLGTSTGTLQATPRAADCRSSLVGETGVEECVHPRIRLARGVGLDVLSAESRECGWPLRYVNVFPPVGVIVGRIAGRARAR